ncbi:unnamed protein product (macronuclear) [Paramecium tetraurelia]|uniref:Uncharacterized protein n=1 Tax=Paramecium tetraurelia TaxID=5888 RepID=A0E6A7_PARTE|nr:uncharacterized protein GSPATT00003689001 [Paramecium tetraurelia]CAK90824.1 unnamed protein product [Paramecium tetraurelia]|eukprot:XP_001458221.1 hypothetical protein (macronuclear) [Paramecium tetraurelia strain d4-2]
MFKVKILQLFDSFVLNTVGPYYRRIGKSLLSQGNDMLGSEASDDRLVQCLRQVQTNGQTPQISDALFTAPNSVLVGNVILKQNSSVWYGATLRADQNAITVGKNALIQDNVYVKATQPVTLGNNSYVGPNSNLQGCLIGDDAFIGMGSTIKQGASVQGIVAAGSLVPEGTQIKQGEVWAGSPAKYLRDITPQELQILREYKQELLELAQVHGEETSKNFRQVVIDTDERLIKQSRGTEEEALQKIAELNFPLEYEDEEFIEQRVFMKQQPPMFMDSENLFSQQDQYEQDLSQFSENMQKYSEDYQIYEEAKKYFESNPQAKANQFQPKNEIPDEKPWSRKY